VQCCAGQQSESRTITLAQAVSLATAQNPNVQIALVDAALAKERQRRALSALLPQASIGFGEATQRINVETSLGTTAGLLPQHEGPFQSFDTGTRFSVPLIDVANLERYRAQKAGARAASADAKTAREEITALTVAQYLLCLRLSATVAAAESH
jgi:outer membrane protein TolC